MVSEGHVSPGYRVKQVSGCTWLEGRYRLELDLEIGIRNEHICPTDSVLWEMATPGRGVYRPPGLLPGTNLKPGLAPDSPYPPYAHSAPPGPPTPLGPDMFPFHPLSVLLPRSVSTMLKTVDQTTHTAASGSWRCVSSLEAIWKWLS